MRRVKGDDFKQMGERKAIERGESVCVGEREREIKRNKR